MVPTLSPRVLSIQSHVVSGYCGNKSAVFPLQLLEFEVDSINTVQMSNHSGYRVFRGQIFTGEDLERIRSGLKANSLLNYDLILSGYVADVSYIISMSRLIQDAKLERKKNGANCRYTLDPVLGDDGVGFYVPEAERIVEAYKKYLLPLADIITPNRFEASILTGIPIETGSPNMMQQTINAIEILHKMGLETVVITSLENTDEPNKLICIASQRDMSDETNSRRRGCWIIKVPKLDCPFTGTGDLFAALFSGWLIKTNYDIKKSLEITANSVHQVLVDTYKKYETINDGSALAQELRIVQNRNSILSPQLKFIAEISDF